MTREELLKKHTLYEEKVSDWLFWGLAYAGGKPFIKAVLTRNERESEQSYLARLNEGLNFNYSKAVVDLFNFYLTEKPCTRNIGTLTDNDQWKLFFEDCDLIGTNFPVFINELQKFSAVYGTVGVLVNKPYGGKTQKEEKENGIYPYCSVFTPPHIWDWTITNNPVTGRPELTYLKLECDDGTILILRPDSIEKWILEKNKPKNLGTWENPLGETPFLFIPNNRELSNPYFGSSDIQDISLIHASIIRNVSCGEEIIKYTAFPQLMLPQKQEGEGGYEERVGVRAVLEFNPEHGDGGKPSWLESKAGEPIDAILRWMDRKTDELNRIAHLSGVYGQRRSKNVVSSGISLRYDFQQLNSALLKKSTVMAEAESKIINLWLKWQGIKTDISIERSKAFSIDDLSLSLNNLILTLAHVASDSYKRAVQRYMVRRSLPDMAEKEFKQINDEIDDAKKEPTPSEGAGS